MVYQKVYIKKDEPLVTGKIDTIPLPLINPISAILLRWHLVTGAGGSAALANEVLVELIKNGSEVLTSMQYGQLAALDVLVSPNLYKIADLGASVTGLYEAFVPFGRYLYDPNYYLDPKGFTSLDLRITQPTFATTTLQNFDVILIRMIDHPYPSLGHFRATTKKEYTAAAAIDYCELDRAFPYAALMLSEMDGVSTDLLSVIGNVRVNVDAGKIFPIDEPSQDLYQQEAMRTRHNLASAIETPLVTSNFLLANWGFPWNGEDALLQAPSFGKLTLETTGLAAGVIRVAGIQLAK